MARHSQKIPMFARMGFECGNSVENHNTLKIWECRVPICISESFQKSRK